MDFKARKKYPVGSQRLIKEETLSIRTFLFLLIEGICSA